MITADLVSYIRKQQERNIPKFLIISKLVKAGWIEEDIEEGFEKIEKEKEESSNPKIDTEIKSFEIKVKEGESFSDKYREPVGEGEPLAKIEIPIIKKELIAKVEEKPRVEVGEKKEQVNTSIELQELELTRGETKSDKPKVWIPMSVPVKEVLEQATEDNLVTQSKELLKPEEGKKEEIIESHIVTPSEQSNQDQKLKASTDAVVDEFVKTETLESKEETKRDYSLDNLPKIAVLTTYPKDVLRIKTDMEEEARQGTVFDPSPKKKISKWMIIIPVVIILLGVGVWTVVSGLVDIKNINIPFIKKDPRALILNNSKILSSLNSYKTETIVEVSFPSIASVSAGLLTGEAVTSQDKDTITLNAVGNVNQNEQGFLSDNSLLVKGTILQNFLNTNIKNDGTSLYVNIPDLSVLLKNNAPIPSVVKINEEEFSGIPSLFGPKAGTLLKKINLYKLLSSGISSYIDKDTLGTYDELIKGVEITEKGQESIKGVETYHYSVIPDRQLFKNLLTKIYDRFTMNLTDEEKEGISTIIGSTTVDSFDIWVGKGDNTIYQYNILLDIPLSKIVGLEDKSIGDNQVRISWKTTYFDFNIANEIVIPETSSSAADFIKSTKIEKMKNQVFSFSPLATNLYKAEKATGVKANNSGSCMSPASGSLFSPTGHPKSATLSVSPISLLLNEILTTTNGLGSCYSSASAWAFTIPLSDNYDPTAKIESYTSFYCIDSKGTTEELTSLPKGISCPSQTEAL